MHCLLQWIATSSSKQQCPMDRRPWGVYSHICSVGVPSDCGRSHCRAKGGSFQQRDITPPGDARPCIDTILLCIPADFGFLYYITVTSTSLQSTMNSRSADSLKLALAEKNRFDTAWMHRTALQDLTYTGSSTLCITRVGSSIFSLMNLPSTDQ